MDINGNYGFSLVRTVRFMGATNNIRVYPNPVSNIMIVDGGTPNSVIRIFDMTGNLVARKDIAASTANFDLSTYVSGAYLVVVSDNSGNTETYRIVKN